MPFVQVDIDKIVRQKIATDPAFAKAWAHRDEIRREALKAEREEAKRERLRRKRAAWFYGSKRARKGKKQRGRQP